MTSTPTLGKPVSRVDGRLKVTGVARYAADAPPANVAHAYLVQSTIARGRVKEIDVAAAEKSPGVLAVLTHKNANVKRPMLDFEQGGKPGEDFAPLSGDVVHYAGQHLAVVVAETFEQAKYAAARVRVTYDAQKPAVEIEDAPAAETPEKTFGEELQVRRGDYEAAAASAAVRVEQTYTTPAEHHNPMETSAATAVWEGEKLTVYDSTQWVGGSQAALAEALGVPKQNVRVVCPFVGGGFGCKGFAWAHTWLAAAAAKKVGRPVKLPLTRRQMFTSVGHRTPTVQAVTLAAGKDGKLAALRHLSSGRTSPVGTFVEACGMATTRVLYACANAHIAHTLHRVNVATPTAMRAPGECPGTFALESAMDELAYALKMDPVRLRLVNHADADPFSGKPWSSKHLKECYQRAGDEFGWAKRNPEPRSMKEPGPFGDILIGWGMATATYPGYRWPSAAAARILADGRAVASAATHDLGTGAYTVFTQVAADALGLPVAKVTFELGDSALPPAPVAGGSNSTASVSPAVAEACRQAKSQAVRLAVADPASPLSGLKEEQVIAADGRLVNKDDPTKGETYADVLKRAGKPFVEARAFTQPGPEMGEFAFRSFGAQFCEVKVDPAIGRVRVTRFVNAFDAGRILNHKTADSQILGGTIMGIGMALTEHTAYDRRTGRPVTDNLADYAVPVNADVPRVRTIFLDRPDPHINPLGCRGVGEIGITGVAAAVANAIFHATGKRVRDLPITPDKLI